MWQLTPRLIFPCFISFTWVCFPELINKKEQKKKRKGKHKSELKHDHLLENFRKLNKIITQQLISQEFKYSLIKNEDKIIFLLRPFPLTPSILLCHTNSARRPSLYPGISVVFLFSFCLADPYISTPKYPLSLLSTSPKHPNLTLMHSFLSFFLSFVRGAQWLWKYIHKKKFKKGSDKHLHCY